jgi:hypothetical protein
VRVSHHTLLLETVTIFGSRTVLMNVLIAIRIQLLRPTSLLRPIHLHLRSSPPHIQRIISLIAAVMWPLTCNATTDMMLLSLWTLKVVTWDPKNGLGFTTPTITPITWVMPLCGPGLHVERIPTATTVLRTVRHSTTCRDSSSLRNCRKASTTPTWLIVRMFFIPLSKLRGRGAVRPLLGEEKLWYVY